MPNQVRIQVENPDELLNAGAYDAGALIRVQSATSQGGAYANLSGTGSTPTIAIVSATRSYTGYDPNGTSTTWYRTRYENAGGTRTSDWSTEFQVGDETAGLICSLFDVKQELGIAASSTGDDETLLDLIRQVTFAIEHVTGRWFTPRSGTYRFHTRAGNRLYIGKGVRALTTLNIATSDQPATGGTYTAQTAFHLDPVPMERDNGWPATTVQLRAPACFYDAYHGAEAIGDFGWAAAPLDLSGVGIRAVIRRFIGKGGGGAAVAVGPSGAEFLLPDMSGADRLTVQMYRVPLVA